MSSFRNVILLGTLSLLIIGSFSLLTDNHTAVTATPSATIADHAQTSATEFLHPAPVHSSFAVLLGILGLIYLKIIWKLIHSPDIFFDEKDPTDKKT